MNEEKDANFKNQTVLNVKTSDVDDDDDTETPTVYHSQISTIRRLPDTDVRAIFECLHESKPQPPNLPFMIVPVGANGLKLSPPSYEFSSKEPSAELIF
jgi:hypothetical protein